MLICDDADKAICEIILTMLTGSLAKDGGFNGAQAGVSHGRNHGSQYLAEHHIVFGESLAMETAIKSTVSKVEKLERLVQGLKEMPDRLEKESRQLVEDIRILKQMKNTAHETDKTIASVMTQSQASMAEHRLAVEQDKMWAELLDGATEWLAPLGDDENKSSVYGQEAGVQLGAFNQLKASTSADNGRSSREKKIETDLGDGLWTIEDEDDNLT
jgi:hypothetical protein